MAGVRPSVLIGHLALALALGAIVVGHLLLIPLLCANTALVDANLARALSEPLALRCGELVLAGCVLAALASKRWLAHRAGLTLSLVAVGVAAIDRLVLIPELHQAWGRVDLVAMRPLARIEVAEQLTLVHQASLGAMVVALVGLGALAAIDRKLGS